MAIKRDDLRSIVINDSKQYKNIFKKRNVSFVKQYKTKQLKYPTIRQVANLNITRHVWGVGDRYWKLAEESYGDPELWWVIAWFNKKPTETHMSAGDVVLIPFPLDTVYDYLGV